MQDFYRVSSLLQYAENFMTGYRVVFDREKLILGWKEADCEFLIDQEH